MKISASTKDALAITTLAAIHAIALEAQPVGGFGYDSAQYLSMMDGGFSDLHPIGYARFLAVIRSLSPSPAAPFVANHLLSLTLQIALYLLARRLWAPGGSLVATLVYVLGSRALLWDGWLLSESLALALLGAQLLLVAAPGGLAALSQRRAVALGLCVGISVLVRSAALFGVVALLVTPRLVEWRSWWRPYARNALVLFAAASIFWVPAGLSHRSQFGTFSIVGTQAGPWNMLYGHPETARCTVARADTEPERVFCPGWALHPRGTLEVADVPYDRLFALAYDRDEPGERLIARYGSFRTAGPHLSRIMRDAILAHPLTYLRESFAHVPRWLEAGDGWYHPNARGFFQEDAVKPLFTRRFPGRWPSRDDSPLRTIPFLSFRIERGMWIFGWIVLLVATARQRRPHPLHLVPLAFLVGTVLTAFAEPRYFAPIELSVFILFLLERERSQTDARDSNRVPHEAT